MSADEMDRIANELAELLVARGIFDYVNSTIGDQDSLEALIADFLHEKVCTCP